MKTLATLTITNARNLSPTTRAALVKWLRQQARDLATLSPNYAPTFRARYIIEGSK